MSTALQTGNLRLGPAGPRTSIRLEPSLWAAFFHIADIEQIHPHALAGKIERQRGVGSRTSAFRIYIVDYWRNQASPQNAEAAA